MGHINALRNKPKELFKRIEIAKFGCICELKLVVLGDNYWGYRQSTPLYSLIPTSKQTSAGIIT